jgi:hypothetical protein
MPQNPLAALRVLLFNVIFTTLFILTSAALDSNSVSIQSQPYYQQQRDCAQGCLFTDHDIVGIDIYLGCQYPALNDCYCRNDLASSASFHITSCLTANSCTATSDLPIAVSAYNNYCQSVSAEDGIAAASTTTSAVSGNNGVSQTTTLAPNLSQPTPSGQSTIPAATYTPSAPASASPSSGTSSNGGQSGNLSTTDQIIIGVAIPVASMVVAILIGRWQWRKEKKLGGKGTIHNTINYFFR